MRPQSVVMFERLFLLSLALSAISFAMGYGEFSQQVLRDPAMRQLGLGASFVIGLALAGYALYLLLWYLIARKAANWAKWLLVVFLAFSLVSLPGAIRGPWTLASAAAIAVYALQVAAVLFLFKRDAKAWLNGDEEVADPAEPD